MSALLVYIEMEFYPIGFDGNMFDSICLKDGVHDYKIGKFQSNIIQIFCWYWYFRTTSKDG